MLIVIGNREEKKKVIYPLHVITDEYKLSNQKSFFYGFM